MLGRRTLGRRRQIGVDVRSANSHRVDVRSQLGKLIQIIQHTVLILVEVHHNPIYAGILLYPYFPPLGRLTSLSVAGDLALCGCLLELDSREKVKDCRVGVTNNISKCLVERFAVVIGTVEVRLYSISLVPGFRWKAGSPSTQSNDPCLLIVAKKRVHLQGLRNVINNGVEGVRNIASIMSRRTKVWRRERCL